MKVWVEPGEEEEENRRLVEEEELGEGSCPNCYSRPVLCICPEEDRH